MVLAACAVCWRRHNNMTTCDDIIIVTCSFTADFDTVNTYVRICPTVMKLLLVAWQALLYPEAPYIWNMMRPSCLDASLGYASTKIDFRLVSAVSQLSPKSNNRAYAERESVLALNAHLLTSEVLAQSARQWQPDCSARGQGKNCF